MLSFFVEKFHNNCRSWETSLFLYLGVDLRSRILAFSTHLLLLYCGFPACFIYSLYRRCAALRGAVTVYAGGYADESVYQA